MDTLDMVRAQVKDAPQTMVAMNCWVFCSVGMMVFNKLAIKKLQVECTLVALQMLVTVFILLVTCWKSLHVGSTYDLLRWLRIAPLFAGVLLTSILALKEAPMTLVITFRCLAPILALSIERLYPNPLVVTREMLGSIVMMIVGAMIYCTGMEQGNWHAVGWIVLNNGFVVGDRLMQRLMLSQEQHPVDISKSACTMLNNIFGSIPMIFLVFSTGEYTEAVYNFRQLDNAGIFVVAMSCIVGCGIGYSGVWLQSLISATSFLVLATASKFIVIMIEVFCMGTRSITAVQIAGACITILAGVYYGKVRERIENQEKEEGRPLPTPAVKDCRATV